MFFLKKKFKNIKKIKYILIILFFIALIPATIFAAMDFWSSGYGINNGNTKDIKYSNSQICKKVTNNSGKNLFIPTKTTPEWNAFETNKPSGVSIGECCTPSCSTVPGCRASLSHGQTTSGVCCGTGEHCYICKTNYTWNGSSCVANTRTKSCTSKPSHSSWNTVSSITQTWDGSSWTPSNTSSYNINPASFHCRFKCDTNYTWNGSSCVANTRTKSCTSKPSHSSWNTVSSITQTWNGSSWTPSNTSSYNINPASFHCRFKCDSGYTWDGNSCESNCTNGCSPSGKTKCESKKKYTCGNYDADSCLEWNSGVDVECCTDSDCPDGDSWEVSNVAGPCTPMGTGHTITEHYYAGVCSSGTCDTELQGVSYTTWDTSATCPLPGSTPGVNVGTNPFSFFLNLIGG